MIAGLGNIDMTLLDGNAHDLWMKNQSEIKEAITIIHKSNNLETQRKAFVRLSNAMYKSIKLFRINNSKAIYYQYCPMAIDNQGAFWLSEVEEINNPYFGEMMLRCGETREIIQENTDL